jgi:PPOX class probable FMN-dependent enzyme
VVISTTNQAGQIDVAPKGDPAGSWQVLDEHTVAIPDRLGNNRADTFFNILDNPRVGLMFVVANRREVVRVSGSGLIVKDPELLASMAIKGKAPDFAIVVRVEEAMFHCGKSMIRSNLWSPEKWASVEGLPTYGQALVDHGKLSISAEDMQAGVERNAIESLY